MPHDKAKLPWMDFHTRDWLHDPQLSMCEISTRGIWIDVISQMHVMRCGVLRGTAKQLAKLCRCTPEEMERAVADLHSTGAAGGVTDSNGVITLVSRRRERDEKRRIDGALRQEKYRESHKSNKQVTLERSEVILTDASSIRQEDVSSGDDPLPQSSDGKPTWEHFVAVYNDRLAKQTHSLAVKALLTMSDARRKHWAARLHEPTFCANWQAILDQAFASDFLMGRVRTEKREPFRLGIDWLIRNNDNYAKIIEGKYANNGTAKHDPRPTTKPFTICTKCRMGQYECMCDLPDKGKHNYTVTIPADADGDRALGLAREAIEHITRRRQ